VEKEGYLQKENWFEEAQKEEKLVLMKDKFGKERVFSIKAKEIQLETEDFIISTLTDVTELHEAMLKAQEASRAKNIFLATMSHELRTPLNAVIGFAQILSTRIESMPKEMIKTYIDKIYVSGKHLLSLVNNILDFTKIESGEVKLDKEKINLKELLEDVLVLVEVAANKKNIKIHKELENIVIEGNIQYLKQAFLNIISNAVKFTPNDKNIYIKLTKNLLEICDEGVGIKKEDIPKIFEPFSQIKEHQLKDIKGTGLGLAITKRIIDMHGFKMEVESEVGKGTCFRLFIK
jgi:signal transduction histidine kinase